MNYKEYLESDHWKEFRQIVLDFWNSECTICGAYSSGGINPLGSVDVHHRHYKTLGKEIITDCVALCRSCHEKHHTSITDLRLSKDKRYSDLRDELYIEQVNYSEFSKKYEELWKALIEWKTWYERVLAEMKCCEDPEMEKHREDNTKARNKYNEQAQIRIDFSNKIKKYKEEIKVIEESYGKGTFDVFNTVI